MRTERKKERHPPYSHSLSLSLSLSVCVFITFNFFSSTFLVLLSPSLVQRKGRKSHNYHLSCSLARSLQCKGIGVKLSDGTNKCIHGSKRLPSRQISFCYYCYDDDDHYERVISPAVNFFYMTRQVEERSNVIYVRSCIKFASEATQKNKMFG